MVSSADLAKAARYVRSVIGTPFSPGAMGPDKFDCWGLARDCERALFNVELPVLAINPNSLKSIIRVIEDEVVKDCWPERPAPSHGDIVTASHSVRGHHVGVWLELDGGGLLHTYEGGDARFQRMTELKMDGWSRFRFHRYTPRGAA